MINNKNYFKIYIKMLILFAACIFSVDYKWNSNITYYIEIQKDINLIIYIYINIYIHKYYMYIHIYDIFNKSFNERSLIE